MRVMNIRYSNKKKVRGSKRKSNQMAKAMNYLTNEFPNVDLDYGYWHMHLPIAEAFIDSSNTPSQTRRLCVQTLIDRVEHLTEIKPKLPVSSRVVAAINLPNLWHSQIIIFFGKEYYGSFFDRKGDYQKWILLSDKRNLVREWNLRLPKSFKVKGYNEEINDEGFKTVSELWYIGELD